MHGRPQSFIENPCIQVILSSINKKLRDQRLSAEASSFEALKLPSDRAEPVSAYFDPLRCAEADSELLANLQDVNDIKLFRNYKHEENGT